MRVQVRLRLGEELTVHIVGTFFALHLDVSPVPPVVQHHLQASATDALTLAHLTGLLAREGVRQQVEQVLQLLQDLKHVSLVI